MPGTASSTGTARGPRRAVPPWSWRLVEGSTLAERIDAGPLPIVEALGIALQTAEVLEVAHVRGIVHRDLKPANVKVGADFGSQNPNRGGTLYRVDVDTAGGGFRPGRPVQIGSSLVAGPTRKGYSISSDGSRILYRGTAVPLAGDRGKLVLGWGREVSTLFGDDPR